MKSIAILAALLLPMSALAEPMHGSMSGNGMSGMQGGGMQQGMHGNMSSGMSGGMEMNGMSQEKMFLKKKQIDGYTVSFHVMPAKEGMQYGGSHNFMVKVEKDGAVQAPVAINSKVVGPDGKAASKMMMKMGDWYMAGYDLEAGGRYQLMVLFKTPDGAKHFGGVYYPDKP